MAMAGRGFWVLLVVGITSWLGTGLPRPEAEAYSAEPRGGASTIGDDYERLVIRNGDVIFLRHRLSGKVVDVQGVYLRARKTGYGMRQSFTIEKPEVGEVCGKIYDRDRIFLRAHTGMRVGVDGEVVTAGNNYRGPLQELIVEAAEPVAGPLRHGTLVYFRAHTGLNVEIFGDVAQCRFDKKGAAQAFFLEKPRNSYRAPAT